MPANVRAADTPSAVHPTGPVAIRTATEAIVGADDALMEKYLSGEVSKEEVISVAPRAVAAQTFVPIFFVNSRAEVGIAELLDAIVNFFPSPLIAKRRSLHEEGGGRIEREGAHRGRIADAQGECLG